MFETNIYNRSDVWKKRKKYRIVICNDMDGTVSTEAASDSQFVSVCVCVYAYTSNAFICIPKNPSEVT